MHPGLRLPPKNKGENNKLILTAAPTNVNLDWEGGSNKKWGKLKNRKSMNHGAHGE
jgi:hypothetical protein